MRDLLIATNNAGKIDEIRTILTDAPFSLKCLSDLGIHFDAEENASTFEGNAIIKAMVYGSMSGVLTLAEDSGLMIDALQGRPGVFTKRYAEGTDDHGHAKILAEIAHVGEGERGAQFVSVLALYDPVTFKVRVCEGVARGSITREAVGTNGFGQDPIFRYDETGRTGGEMTREEKNAVSHRAHALAKMKDILLTEYI